MTLDIWQFLSVSDGSWKENPFGDHLNLQGLQTNQSTQYSIPFECRERERKKKRGRER